MKQKEIETMIEILRKNGLNVNGYWIPDDGVDGIVTVLFNCNIPSEVIEDFEKLEELEYNLYELLKPVLEKSRFFKMVGLL